MNVGTKRIRRSPVQIAKDEKAILAIVERVKTANRWDIKALRETVDQIADELVTAGRL